jgi:hypothetical protein
VAPGTTVLVLSGDYDNRVMQFLQGQSGQHPKGASIGQQDAYRVITVPKPYGERRELNAIHDLLAATANTATKTFIGVYESSYSYTVMFRLFKIRPQTNAVIFHMKQLHKPEMVFTSTTDVDEMRRG